MPHSFTLIYRTDGILPSCVAQHKTVAEKGSKVIGFCYVGRWRLIQCMAFCGMELWSHLQKFTSNIFYKA
jgi:hypothetical protein